MKRFEVRRIASENFNKSSSTNLKLLGDIMGYNTMDKEVLVSRLVLKPTESERAVKCFFRTYVLDGRRRLGPTEYMEMMRNNVLTQILKLICDGSGVSIGLSLICEMTHQNPVFGETEVTSST